jgi:putative solute:sodium symporter small subunit
MSNSRATSYWKSNLKIVSSLLCVWFVVSFGCGILLVDFLDNFRFGGFKLGFWMAQQGSIFVFVVLIYVYILLMDKLDDQYNEAAATDNDQGPSANSHQATEEQSA